MYYYYCCCCWRCPGKLTMVLLLFISLGLCVIVFFPTITHHKNLSSHIKRKQRTSAFKPGKTLQSKNVTFLNYQQVRTRLQMHQLSKQSDDAAGHCFQIWEKSYSVFPEPGTGLNDICRQDNWFLFDSSRQKENSYPVPFSSSLVPVANSTNSLSRFPPSQLSNNRVYSTKQTLQQKLNSLTKGTSCFQRWMTLLHPRLCNIRLGDLMIPGTHNSASFSVSPNGTLIEKLWVSRLALALGFHDYYTSWARNHEDNILAQLNAGYRCFDLRIALLPTGSFHWWHGISGEAIDSGLKDIANFARKNPGEVIILLISHLNAPGDGETETLPMPDDSKIKLGQHLLSILGPNLVPTRNISPNPTISSVLATGRNVIALIREDLDLVKAFPEYFWGDRDNQTALVEFFERKTNPRSMFHHRSFIMQKYKRQFPDRLAITPAFVTHSVPNILGGILRSSRVAWILSLVFALMFYIVLTSWPIIHASSYSTIFYCQLKLRNVINVKCWWKAKKSPIKFVGVCVMYATVISLSVSLARIHQRSMLHFWGFEGRATNLLEMARIGNLCGDDPSQPVTDIKYQSINSMIRHWSDRQNIYRLNIVLVDDFTSSHVVQTAIQENIKRANTMVTGCNDK